MRLFEPRFIPEFLPKLLAALPVTLGIVLVAATAGLAIGLLLAVARLEKVPGLAQISAVLISFLRGTPILVQLYLVYYGLPALLKLVGIDIMRWEPIVFVYIAYSLNSAAFFAEILRSAVLAVPRRQWDAAYAAGLTRPQVYRRVVLPQSVRIALPSAGMTITSLLQDTAVASVSMGILDVMGRANTLGALTSRVLEAYVAAAVIFIVLTLTLERVFQFLNRREKKEKLL